MAAVIENLFVAIRADSKGLDSDLKGVLRKFKKLENVGKNLSLKLSLPILAVSGVVLKMAGDFESAMNTVAAKSGATGKEFKKLEDLAKSLGATTRFSATQAAQGMAFLAQAGFDTNQILAALPATLNLASAGNLELARAADIASNVLKGFRLPAEEAGRAADVLALAAARTNTDVEELGAAMSRVAPVSADLGVSMEETAAAIGAMSDAGVKGFRAGTALRAIFAKLAGATGQASKAMDRLGINTRDFEGKFVGLPALMEQFAKAEREAADEGQFFADKVKIFGTEMVSSAGILINKGGPALQKLTDEFVKAGGASQRMTDIMEKGFVGALRILRSALESLAIAIGDSGLLKFAENLARRLADLVREIAAFDPATLRFIGVLAGMAAAIGPVLVAIGLFGPAMAAAGAAILGFAGGPIGAAIVAAGLLAAAFLATRDSTVKAFEDIGESANKIKDIEFAGSLARQSRDLAVEIRDLEAVLTSLGIEFRRQRNESLEDYREGLKLIRDEMALLSTAQEIEIQKLVATSAAFNIGFAAVENMEEMLRIFNVAAGNTGDALKKVGDKIGVVGTQIKSFGQKVTDSVKGFRDAAESVRVSAAAWDIWAGVLDKAEAAANRFDVNKATSQIEAQIPLLETALKGWAGLPPAIDTAGASMKQLGGIFDQSLPKFTSADLLIASLGEQLRKNAAQADLYATAQAILTERIAMGGEAGREAAETLGLLAEKMGEGGQASKDLGTDMQAVSTILDDLFKSLADFVLGMQSFADTLKGIGQAIVRTIVDQTFKAMRDEILANDKALKKLIDTFKKFLGLGSATENAAGNAGDVITKPGSDAGGVGGLAGGPLGIITSIGSLISSIISNFQLARLEGSLNKIELNTRQTTRALTGAPELLAKSAQMIGQAAGEISDASRKGFAIASSTRGFDDPRTFVPTNTTPTVVPAPPGLPLGPPGPEEGAGAPGPQQGLGIIQVLFEQSDFMQKQLGQLEFQTASLDTLKEQSGRREKLLEVIRDSLSGIGGVGFGGAVVPALLGEINEAVRVGGDLITGIRDQVNAVRQQLTFDRDIVQVTRDQQLRAAQDTLKEIKLLVFNTGQPQQISINEFGQAAFRNQLGPEGVLP